MFELYYFPILLLIPHIYLEELKADYFSKNVNLKAEEQLQRRIYKAQA